MVMVDSRGDKKLFLGLEMSFKHKVSLSQMNILYSGIRKYRAGETEQGRGELDLLAGGVWFPLIPWGRLFKQQSEGNHLLPVPLLVC